MGLANLEHMSVAKLKATIFISVVVIVTITAVGWAFISDGSDDNVSPECKLVQEASVPPPAQVTVRIYNASAQVGVGSTLAKELRQRSFVVSTVANDPRGPYMEDSVELRFGPGGASAAQLLLAHFTIASTSYNDNRKDNTVDIAIGRDYAGLVMVNQVGEKLTKLPPMSKLIPDCG